MNYENTKRLCVGRSVIDLHVNDNCSGQTFKYLRTKIDCSDRVERDRVGEREEEREAEIVS